MRSNSCLVALSLVLAVLAASACARDEGRQRLERADALYASLVERGVPPNDPAYDQVLAELEAIAEGSSAHAQAQQRLRALRTLRAPLPPRPLSVPGAQPREHEHQHEPRPGDGG